MTREIMENTTSSTNIDTIDYELYNHFYIKNVGLKHLVFFRSSASLEFKQCLIIFTDDKVKKCVLI